jgi:hypothetical protein
MARFARRVLAGRVTVPGSSAGGTAAGGTTTARSTAAVQLQMAGDTAQVHDLTELRPHEIPVLRTLREPEPVGRAAIVGQVAAQLRAQTSVQLYGPAGIGKKAIARAVIREFSRDAVRGVELRPRLSQENDLTTVFELLAGVFFHVNVASPAEEQLAAAAHGISALVVICDCELPAGQVARLLATFPGCVFLLTSQHLTIGRAGAAREIEPLDRRSALTLVAQELGHDTAGPQQAQAEQACDLAAGQVQRLLLYAAFLRSTEWWPGHRPLPELTVAEVATVLAGGLSEPARQVLVALATFGTGVPPDLFAAVAGMAPLRPGGDLAVADELLTARLVTEQGSEISITADANAAVRAIWPPVSAQIAAQRLLPLLVSGDAARPVSADLLVAVARQLAGRSEDAQLATRFIRAAAPAAMRARQTRAWVQLTALGLHEARVAGSQPDLEYFLQEEHTRALFQGDRAAAAAAILELQGLQGAAPPSAPGRRPPGRVRRWLGAHSAAQIGVLTAITAVLAAGAFVAAYKITTVHSGGPAPQLTGSQLEAALLPPSDFFRGRTGRSAPSRTIPDGSFSTGASLVAANPAAGHISCQLFSARIGNSSARQEAAKRGLTAAVRRVDVTPAAATGSESSGAYGDYQEIYQRPGPARARDFFLDIQPCASRPPGSAVRSTGITHLSVGGDPAFTYTLTRISGTSQPVTWERVLIALDGPDVFQLVLQVRHLPRSALPSLAAQEQLMLKLIENVRTA